MGEIFPIYIVAVFSVWAPLCIGIRLHRDLKPDMKILLLWLAVVALVEGYTFYETLNRKNYYWVYHMYLPVEYGLLALVFSFWQNNVLIKKSLRLSIPIFTLGCVAYTIFWGDLGSLSTISISTAYMIYIGISGYTLVSLRQSRYRSILKDYRFWASVALLLYSSGSLAYFGLFAYFISFGLWTIHALLNTVANAFYSVGFICQVRR